MNAIPTPPSHPSASLGYGVPRAGRWLDGTWLAAVAKVTVWKHQHSIIGYVSSEISLHEAATAFSLGAITLFRVLVLIALATLI